MPPRFHLRRRQPPAADLAEQVVELVKASLPGLGTLPPGTQAREVPSAELEQMQNPTRPDTTATLPRDPLSWQVGFGPGNPIFPAPLDPRLASGRAIPRRWEYPVSWNLQTNLDFGRHVPWSVLIDAAERIDLIRWCIELRRVELTNIDWDVTINPKFVQKVMHEQGKRPADRVAKAHVVDELRGQFQDDIDRCVDFWQHPDRTNGYGWGDWLMTLLDEYFTLDALSVYPHVNLGGRVMEEDGFEQLDGSTIKPLLDHRGSRPRPPAPAYQQILYGFPRGEYTASSPESVDGSFAADRLIYKPRHRRTRTPYGFSPVEQALIAANLYLKRQAWLTSEYDDGSDPKSWMKTDSDFTPDQRAQWETVLNDLLAGQTSERHRLKVLPKGFEPEAMAAFEERYKPDFDEHLVKIMCIPFAVQPTEIGFTPRHGLGGRGHEEGQENVTYRRAIGPDTKWLVDLHNDLSWTYLAMPRELTFTFEGLETEDEMNVAKARDLDLRNGSMTLNEIRAETGQPLYDDPAADEPVIVAGQSIVPVSQVLEQNQPPPPPAPAGTPGSAGTSPPGPGASPPAAGAPAAAGGKPARAATTTKAASGSPREQVYRQLLEDYPADAIGWVRDPAVTWAGPEEVPVALLDYGNRDRWQASHEPAKVARMQAKIQRGKRKPVVLAATPANPKLVVLDGHHRALAYRKLGQPALAYVATVPSDSGPWGEMHASQLTEAETGDDTARAEARKFLTYAAKRTRTGRGWRDFAFAHVGEADAADLNLLGAAGDLDAVKVLVADLGKAGARQRRAPERPSEVQDWPGWRFDMAIGRHYAPELQGALAGLIGDPRSLASEYLRVHGGGGA